MVNPILCLPIHDGNWLFEVCFQCLHRCHYLRMGAEQYFRLVSQTQRPERPDKQQRVDSTATGTGVVLFTIAQSWKKAQK